MSSNGIARLTLALLLLLPFLVGCPSAAPEPKGDKASEEIDTAEAGKPKDDVEEDPPVGEPLTFEIDAESLNSAMLGESELQEGWIRIFDQQSPFGWFIVGKANWHIRDDLVRVSKGEKSFLCTSFQLSNYEFKVDFRADSETNSGIFLRTGPHPENVAEDCLELNIAPPDNPFPTGSFVQRKKIETEELGKILGSKFDPTVWHTYHVKLVGSNCVVYLDGKQVMELTDFKAMPIGHISLQHNEGRVEFRNMLLRPVTPEPLAMNADWSKDWEESTKDDAKMTVDGSEEGVRLQGGLGQLQSKKDFGDFFLQASYTLAKPEVNSGIFFRCIRDNMLDGYECQVNHAIEGDDPLRPADAGAGAIFRRQPARMVMGDGTTKTYISILANGPQIVTWVNGIQVADFVDTRDPDENPRRGLRLDPGPISIQAHDSTTDVTFHSLTISEP